MAAARSTMRSACSSASGAGSRQRAFCVWSTAPPIAISRRFSAVTCIAGSVRHSARCASGIDRRALDAHNDGSRMPRPSRLVVVSNRAPVEMVRGAGVPVRVGVFWHIPFPPPTVFGILRWREELLTELLGADLLAFQTEADVRNFLASVRQFLHVPVVDDPPTVRLAGRDVRVTA